MLRTPGRFSALRSPAEHARVHREVARLFRDQGARRTRAKLQDGLLPAHYHPALDIWLAAHPLENRFRNALGVGDPVGRTNLWPTVQLNLAKRPGGARPRARFLRDDSGRIWLAHSGTLGGRQPGISREGFLAFLGGARVVAIDGGHETLVILGTFSEPVALLGQIARLTHGANAFRSALAAGLTP